LRTGSPDASAQALTFATPERIRELAHRGEALGTSEAKQMADPSLASECDIKDAPFIALERPVHSLLEEPRDDPFYVEALWFRKTDIRIDYQVSKTYEERQRALLEQRMRKV
jgi:hypothetical protein